MRVFFLLGDEQRIEIQEEREQTEYRVRTFLFSEGWKVVRRMRRNVYIIHMPPEQKTEVSAPHKTSIDQQSDSKTSREKGSLECSIRGRANLELFTPLQKCGNVTQLSKHQT